MDSSHAWRLFTLSYLCSIWESIRNLRRYSRNRSRMWYRFNSSQLDNSDRNQWRVKKAKSRLRRLSVIYSFHSTEKIEIEVQPVWDLLWVQKCWKSNKSRFRRSIWRSQRLKLNCPTQRRFFSTFRWRNKQNKPIWPLWNFHWKWVTKLHWNMEKYIKRLTGKTLTMVCAHVTGKWTR